MASPDFEKSSSTPTLAIVRNPDVVFDRLIDLKLSGESSVDGQLVQYRSFLFEQWQGVADLAAKAPEKKAVFGDFLGQEIATNRLVAFERDRMLIYQSGVQIGGLTCFNLQVPINGGGGEVLGVNFIFEGELERDNISIINALLITGTMTDIRGLHIRWQRSMEAKFGGGTFRVSSNEFDEQRRIYDKFYWELPHNALLQEAS